jgi:hypothetical protein
LLEAIAYYFLNPKHLVMKKLLVSIILTLCFIVNSEGQKVLFIHHSTGGNVYSEGKVAAWFTNYNTTNGKNYQVTERAYPDSPYPWDNYPYDYWNLWVNPATTCNSTNPKIECINTITQNYNVIVFKHCFPGAGIGADGATSSVSSSAKTLGNYKLQYRALRAMMDGYPNNKFIVWTLTPLHRNATSVADAARAKQFVDWVKTTWLTEDSKSHPNIFIFDFWGIMAESNATPAQGKVNCLKYDYEGDHNGSDSHPNTAANLVAGPLFGQFVVNCIENKVTAIPNINGNLQVKVYPCPSNGIITLETDALANTNATFAVTNTNGQVVYQTTIYKTVSNIDLSHLSNGIYFYSVKTGKGQTNAKLLIAK